MSYQTFWMDKEVVKATQFFVSMEELRTCYPLRSLFLKSTRALCQRRSRSVRVHLPALWDTKSSRSTRCNNSQTTPGIIIYNQDFQMSFSLSSHVGMLKERFVQLIDEHLYKENQFFWCYWRRQNALRSSLIWPSNRNGIWLILSRRFDQGEALFIGNRSFWESQFFPNKKYSNHHAFLLITLRLYGSKLNTQLREQGKSFLGYSLPQSQF